MSYLKSLVICIIVISHYALMASGDADNLLAAAEDAPPEAHFKIFQDHLNKLDSSAKISVCRELKRQKKYRLLSFFAARHIALGMTQDESKKVSSVSEMVRAVNKVDDSHSIFEKGEIHFYAFTFYKRIDAPATATEYLTKSINFFEQIDKYDRLAHCWRSSGLMMYELGDYHNAIYDFRLALDYYFKGVDSERSEVDIISGFNNLALSFQKIGKLDSALHYYEIALDLAKKNNDQFWVALVEGNKSIILIDQGYYAEAKEILLKDIDVSLEFGHYNSAINAQLVVADLFLKLSDTDSARYYLESAALNSDHQSKKLPKEYFLTLSNYYRATSDFEKALDFSLAYIAKNDSEKTTIEEASEVYKTRFDRNLDLVKLKLEESILNEQNQEKEIQQQKLLTLMITIFLLISLVLLVAYLRKNKMVGESITTIANLNVKLAKSNEQMRQSNEGLMQEKEKLNNALDELEKVQEQALRNDRMTSLGILTRGISHEINNPLNLLSLGLQIIQSKGDELDPQERSDLLSGMSDGVLRANQIVRNLGEFSKNSSKTELCNINSIIENSLGVLAHDVTQSGLTILKEYYPESLQIVGYSGELHQVILNLLSRCIQSLDTHPKIVHIRTFTNEDRACISIKDNGKGLSRESLSQIFDHTSMKEQGELSLYLTQRYVENNNGNITCISSEEEGTEFYLSFPLNL